MTREKTPHICQCEKVSKADSRCFGAVAIWTKYPLNIDKINTVALNFTQTPNPGYLFNSLGSYEQVDRCINEAC